MDLVVTLSDSSKANTILKYLKQKQYVKKIVAVDASGKKEVKLSNREMVTGMFAMSSAVISKSLSRK